MQSPGVYGTLVEETLGLPLSPLGTIALSSGCMLASLPAISFDDMLGIAVRRNIPLVSWVLPSLGAALLGPLGIGAVVRTHGSLR